MVLFKFKYANDLSCNTGNRRLKVSKFLLFVGEGLRVPFLIYLRRCKICQLTVRYLKQEKSALRHRKSRLKRE